MSQALVDIREQLKKELADLKNTVPAPTGRTISTKGKVFTFPDGKTHQGPIEAVVLDYRNLNLYYSTAYNPNNPVPPKCFALGKTLELKPHEEVKEPQAETCASCTWNQWGSAPTGRGKACRNTIRLAIVAPDATEDAEPYILKVSPTGIKSWASLANLLATKGLVPFQVVTQIAFDPNQAYPTLVFKPLRPVEDDRLATFWAIREKAQAVLDRPPAATD